MRSHFVNFEADHALQNYEFLMNRNADPSKIKIWACSCREVMTPKNGKHYHYAYNDPGAKIWAYIITNDIDVKSVRESHVREAVAEDGFKEITPDFLKSIATLPYDQQRWPT